MTDNSKVPDSPSIHFNTQALNSGPDSFRGHNCTQAILNDDVSAAFITYGADPLSLQLAHSSSQRRFAARVSISTAASSCKCPTTQHQPPLRLLSLAPLHFTHCRLSQLSYSYTLLQYRRYRLLSTTVAYCLQYCLLSPIAAHSRPSLPLPLTRRPTDCVRVPDTAPFLPPPQFARYRHSKGPCW